MDIDTTLALKGVAIILLVVGHMARYRILEGAIIGKGPFYIGRWAVMIFLFVSGYGLSKKYGINQIDSEFWLKRFKKLYFPLWVSLFFFIISDYFVLDIVHNPIKLIFNFFGIFWRGNAINANAWFVTYIICLYLILFSISNLKINRFAKILFLFLFSFIISIAISLSSLEKYFTFWKQYTLAFPLGVCFATYHEELLNVLDYLYNNRLVSLMILISSIFIFILSLSNHYISNLIPNNFKWIYTQFQVIPFYIFIIAFLSIIVKFNYKSKFLLFFGKYSYEIYLIHFPIIVRYDIYNYQNSFLLYFFFSFFVILFLSITLSHICSKAEYFIHQKI